MVLKPCEVLLLYVFACYFGSRPCTKPAKIQNLVMCDAYVLTELTIQSIASIEDHKPRDVQGQEPASNICRSLFVCVFDVYRACMLTISINYDETYNNEVKLVLLGSLFSKELRQYCFVFL